MPGCRGDQRANRGRHPGTPAPRSRTTTGGGDHFRATVTAPAFAGLSRIEQHRLVYDVFGEEIGGPIHALSLKTQTPLTTATH